MLLKILFLTLIPGISGKVRRASYTIFHRQSFLFKLASKACRKVASPRLVTKNMLSVHIPKSIFELCANKLVHSIHLSKISSKKLGRTLQIISIIPFI